MNCPICGHPEGACKGEVRTRERQIITSEGVVRRRGPERVPVRRSRVGHAGYVGEATGEVELYDPAAPNIRFVSGAEEPEEMSEATTESEAVEPAPKRRKKADK